MARTADAVVAQLLRFHLGLDDCDDASTTSNANAVRSFRDLYQLSFLHTSQAKRELLRAAEATACSGVLLDVLLFLSQTMAPALFTKELALMPVALSQWIHYASEQCVVNNETVSLDALHGLLELYSTTKRFQDLATLLLGLVAKEKRKIDKALRVATEVAAIVKHYRHRFPNWILELINEHVALLELQVATEQRDAFTAPAVYTKSGYMDKRARGTMHLQANWRMRYFQLDASELAYSKHDAEKLATSRNPFLDKRQKGSVALSKGLSVKPIEYNGKMSKRPHCIQIGEGDRALIIDPCTPVVQFEWLTALTANIKRLELDPVWLAFPRGCVHHMTMAEFLQYALLYHSGDRHRNGTMSAAAGAVCDPQTLRERFQIDDRRFYYSLLQQLARTGDWREFEAHTRPTKSLSIFPVSNSNSSSQFDPSCVGFGAILDLALAGNAPLSLVADLEALYQKHETKSSARLAWSCRRTGDESAASLAIRIEVPDRSRAESY